MNDLIEIKNLCSRMQPEARRLILKMSRLYFARWPMSDIGQQHLSLLLLKERLIKQPLGNCERIINDRLCGRVTAVCLPEYCEYA